MLKERIDAFVKRADELVVAYWKQQGYTHPIRQHRADYISDKWVRVVVIEDGKVGSVYGFIALVDNTTKSLGTVKAGDIHKAAGFKAPAKTARGSVFAEDFGNCLTPFGIKHIN